MKLVQAAPGEEAAVIDMLSAAFADYVKAAGRERAGPYTWLRAALEAGQIYWIDDGDTRVGATNLSRNGTTLKIEQIGIHPDAQGLGIGGRALAAIEDHARSEGAFEVTLHAGQMFYRLVAFYSRHGYRVQAVGPHP